MKPILLLAVTLAVSAFTANAQSLSNTKAEQTAPVTVITNTDAFPVFVNTGNKEQDIADYKIRKDNWIAAHPKEYEAMKANGVMTPAQENARKNKVSSKPTTEE